jgi:hypothetical protein
MLFSFVQGGRGSVCPGAALLYVPREWVGESHLVFVAHLLGLQIYKGSFETGQQGEMAFNFSQGRHLLGLDSVQWGVGRLSMG